MASPPTSRYKVTIFNAEPRVNYDRIMLSPVLSGEKSKKDDRPTKPPNVTQ